MKSAHTFLPGQILAAKTPQNVRNFKFFTQNSKTVHILYTLDYYIGKLK